MSLTNTIVSSLQRMSIWFPRNQFPSHHAGAFHTCPSPPESVVLVVHLIIARTAGTHRSALFLIPACKPFFRHRYDSWRVMLCGDDRLRPRFRRSAAHVGHKSDWTSSLHDLWSTMADRFTAGRYEVTPSVAAPEVSRHGSRPAHSTWCILMDLPQE